MKYRRLGKTGLEVSEIGFGTIPILKGNVPVLPDYYNLEEEEALWVMEAAFRLGCNLFDTAIVPEYGDAELKLGKFAARVGREKLIISDKARFFDGNEMYQAVLTSCENLGTSADLYFVHQVDGDHEEEVFRPGGALDALTELKAEGGSGMPGSPLIIMIFFFGGPGTVGWMCCRGAEICWSGGCWSGLRRSRFFVGKGF